MLTELKKHLTGMQQNGIIESWCDRDISAGTEWEPEIAKQLNSAHIILLLISANFMASDYCYGKEMKRALERHESGEARVIPVILRPVYWQYEPFSKLQALPTEGKAVIKWRPTDDAFLDITDGLADVIRDISIKEERSIKELQVQALVSFNISNVPRKKALLVLAGGRPSADILALLYLQPHLVVIIAPHEWPYQKTYVDIAHTVPSCEVKVISNVDVFDIEACIKACTKACLPYPDTEWEWIFTTSTAAKVMSLAGYELAKQKSIPCWQVDLLHERVISLVKETEVNTQRFFHLTVDEYMKNYGYAIANRGLEGYDYKSKLMAWGNIAQELVFSSDTDSILGLLRDKKVGHKTTLPQELKASTLLQSLEKSGLLEITYEGSDCISVHTTSHKSARFLGTGDWLEFYIWHEIINAGFADDCQWDISILNERVKFNIDLALTYKARLLIAEFCTSRSVLHLDQYLARLDSNANLLGGGYVSKIFIINQPSAVNSSYNRYYDTFWERAKLRNIVVVTKEDLPSIGGILKREMTSPTYTRI